MQRRTANMDPGSATTRQRMGKALRGWLTRLAMIAFVLATPAQEAPPSEYQVKAAFLYNFAKFVEWPPGSFAASDTPITIGILGDNPFGPDLERMLRNKTVEGRALVVRAIRSLDDLKPLKTCHIVFVSAGVKKPLREIIDSLQSASVLTVGETDRFTESGGMINLVMEGKKVRFDINDQSARQAGLKISPRLLKLARNHGAGE